MIYESSLESLQMNSFRRLKNGLVCIIDNQHLCYVQEASGFNWSVYANVSSKSVKVINNKNHTECGGWLLNSS